MREGDVEALRNKLALEGRPMKSKIITDGKTQTFIKTNDKGHVQITDKLDIGG